MVIVSKEEKRAIFTYLLKEGTIVVKKDSYLPKHQSLEISNLKVQMIMKSLKSRGFVNDVFSWMWSYYTVTNAGVAFLVKELGVSSDVVPATYKKKRVVAAPKVEDDGDEKETPAPETAE
jgi:small subunit ribosomal protein S10e